MLQAFVTRLRQDMSGGAYAQLTLVAGLVAALV